MSMKDGLMSAADQMGSLPSEGVGAVGSFPVEIGTAPMMDTALNGDGFFGSQMSGAGDSGVPQTITMNIPEMSGDAKLRSNE